MNTWLYTECTKHYIELHALFPTEQPQFVRGWTLQGVESVPQGCWPMLTPMLPQLLDGLWWKTILDTRGKLLSMKNPAAMQLLTQTCAPGTYYNILVKGP